MLVRGALLFLLFRSVKVQQSHFSDGSLSEARRTLLFEVVSDC